jgi:hypothetical protein
MQFKKRIFLFLLISGFFYSNIYCQQKLTKIGVDNSFIQYEGRIGMKNPGIAEIYWPGSSCKIKFKGTALKAILKDERGDNYYNIIIDENNINVLKLDTAKKEYTLASHLPESEHRVELFRRTGWTSGITWLYGFVLPAGAKVLQLPTKKRMIEFYGNSITAGAAVEDYLYASGDTTSENNYISYAAITARHFNAKYSCIALSGIGLMVSWGSLIMPDLYDRLNPNDSMSKWNFAKVTPDIVVINLLQNDNALVGMPDYPQFKKRFGDKAPTEDFIIESYRKFVQGIRHQYPKSHIVCVLGSMDAVKPGSLWPGYIQKAVESLKDKAIYTHFFTFINRPEHPNVTEQRQMAESLIRFIKEHIKW